MEDNVSRLAQPYHYTVKTFAERYDGKKPFTVEASIHLAISDIDGLEKTDSAFQTGMQKLIDYYKSLGYSHLPELNVDVKPVPKK